MFTLSFSRRDHGVVGWESTKGGLFCKFFKTHCFQRCWIREVLLGTQRANLSKFLGVKSVEGPWWLLDLLTGIKSSEKCKVEGVS